MNELTLRVRAKDGRKWIPASAAAVLETLTNDEILPETVGLYSGLKDQNGIAIASGDIVLSASVGPAVVRFGTYSAINDANSRHVGFYLDWLGRCQGRHIPRKSVYRNDLGYFRDLTVIGNIYDDAELLAELSDETEK